MTIGNMTPGNGRAYKEAGTVVNLADKAEEKTGGKGFVYISDTSEHTPSAGNCFFALYLLEATVISAYTADSSAPVTGTITGVSFPAGTYLYGKFTSVTLTSGSLIAYNAVL